MYLLKNKSPGTMGHGHYLQITHTIPAGEDHFIGL